MGKNYREILFLHLQGIVLLPTLNQIFNSKIIDIIINNKEVSIKSLSKEANINEGYINVAFRALRSANLLLPEVNDDELQIKYTPTEDLNLLYKHKENIETFSNLLYYHENFSSLNTIEFEEYSKLIDLSIDVLNKFKEQYNHNSLYYKFEGLLLGPILNNLSFNGYFDQLENDNFVIKNLNENFRNSAETAFVLSDLIHISNENFSISDKGTFFFQKSSSYGVTCSYIPTLSKLDELLFKNCSFIWDKDENNNELHVDRSMNVWGSGGAHKTYFNKIDKIILNLFNKPINEQPKGVVDVGCGDGTFLKHVYTIIKNRTLRGKHLNEHPLDIIGVDINKAARISSRKKLNKANIDNIIINGSINEPKIINDTLAKQYRLNLNKCLNMRTFLDHNRIYSEPKNILYKEIKSSGAFSYKGKLISNNEIINNLIEHLSNWTPYINKFGLILLELHTIVPEFTKKNQELTPAIAYDTTHGFSDQYLVEHSIFKECLEQAGLSIDLNHQYLFPNKENPTISINYIK